MTYDPTKYYVIKEKEEESGHVGWQEEEGFGCPCGDSTSFNSLDEAKSAAPKKKGVKVVNDHRRVRHEWNGKEWES